MTLFHCSIVIIVKAPLCSLNNVHIFSDRPCVPLGLATCCNVNFDPLASIKRLFSVPRCCVLPEDMVSGLAMHGKPVALSRGATIYKQKYRKGKKSGLFLIIF